MRNIPAATGPSDCGLRPLFVEVGCGVKYLKKLLVIVNGRSYFVSPSRTGNLEKMKKQGELGIDDGILSTATLEKLQLLKKLLPNATSIPVVSDFLKSKKLHHSAGSWEEMWEKRILPYLRLKKISVEELVHLLNEGEEYGRCHTFLFIGKRKDAERCMELNRVKAIAEKHGVSSAITDSLVVDAPTEPTLTSIREDSANGQKCLIFKVVETRQEKSSFQETRDGNKLRWEWTIQDIRAVNVARLHANGLLEICIQSHLNTTQYISDVRQMLAKLTEFIPPTLFAPFSLAKAKKQLWENRESMKKKIRFNDSTMRNRFGTTLSASTGNEEADLFNDSGVAGSIDYFLGHGAECNSSNVSWRPIDGVLERDIHMRLSGHNNEFAITAKCTRLEYEYLLNELRIYSK